MFSRSLFRPSRVASAVFAVFLRCGAAAAQDASTEVEALRAQLQQITQRLAALESKAATTSPPPVDASAPVRSGASYMNLSFDTLIAAGASSASDPSAELQLGDHDPKQSGFSLRNAEIAIDGNVDPYFKGFGNIALKLENDNETEIELEEAYLLTTSLPGALQVKAGQFFAEFGRQNAQHPHTWSFVDQPLVLNRMFGGDGLRNVGARVAWLAPTPFYTEVLLGVFNGGGGTAFSFRHADVEGTHGRTPADRGVEDVQDLLFVPRVASSFDLTPNQTLVVGASGAFGPNDSGADTRSRIMGVDTYWKWKPARADAGFPFVAWQTEALWRDYEAGADPETELPAETLGDWGFYTQVLCGFRPRWVAGLRGEFVDGNRGAYDEEDIMRGQRTRISPNLTFLPSEFSKLRLQYNADHGDRFGDEQSVWLQMEFLLGAHGAHKF